MQLYRVLPLTLPERDTGDWAAVIKCAQNFSGGWAGGRRVPSPSLVGGFSRPGRALLRDRGCDRDDLFGIKQPGFSVFPSPLWFFYLYVNPPLFFIAEEVEAMSFPFWAARHCPHVGHGLNCVRIPSPCRHWRAIPGQRACAVIPGPWSETGISGLKPCAEQRDDPRRCLLFRGHLPLG